MSIDSSIVHSTIEKPDFGFEYILFLTKTVRLYKKNLFCRVMEQCHYVNDIE